MNVEFIATPKQEELDSALLLYDLWGTKAHVGMLAKIGLFSPGEIGKLNQAFAGAEEKINNGNFEIDSNLGAQLSLERELIDQVGEAIAKKVHTARSRNDQVITAEKLYIREKILELMGRILDLIETLAQLVGQHRQTVMPGYTHMQPAKPTSVSQWLLAYIDMFLRDIERLRATFTVHNTNPLGAAESYGTSWPIDRELTTKLLGFNSVQEIPLDAVASRGEMQIQLLADLAILHLHLSKLAQDSLLLSTFEFGMIEIGESIAKRQGKLTGSSIMPQKRNLDVLELIRANTSFVNAALLGGLEVLKALPFGYNRDSREIKEYVQIGIDRSLNDLRQMQFVFKDIKFHRERLLQAVRKNFSLSTDLADAVAQRSHTPYRVVHEIVGDLVNDMMAEGKELGDLSAEKVNSICRQNDIDLELTEMDLKEILDPVASLKRRSHCGGTAQEEIDRLLTGRQRAIEVQRVWIQDRQKENEQAKCETDAYLAKLAAGR